MAERGDLVRLASGVYLVAGAPLTFRARLWAAILATGGTLGFATAAYLWGVTDAAADQVHVCVPPGRRPRPPEWVRIHRVLVPASVRHTRAGLPATSRAWTVLDHVGTLSVREATTIFDRAVQREWICADDLTVRLRSYPNRSGNLNLRHLATLVGDGAAAESERRLHRLLRRSGIRGWQANYEVWQDGYLVAVVDVALVEAAVAIEVDGQAHHVDVERFRRDRHRQNALVGLGWTVLRFTWADLTHRPGYVVATVRRQLDQAHGVTA